MSLMAAPANPPLVRVTADGRTWDAHLTAWVRGRDGRWRAQLTWYERIAEDIAEHVTLLEADAVEEIAGQDYGGVEQIRVPAQQRHGALGLRQHAARAG
jgi:hypothetical protein